MSVRLRMTRSISCEVVSGAVHMQQNYALTDDEVACGAILTCQSRPTTDEVTIDYDR